MIQSPKLPPFKRMCVTIGAIPATYIESLSYYETLLWLCKYLSNTVIPAINANADAVTELQQSFITLQEYVNNYFENLDIQEEINNKLDEMAKSGELAEIIAQYLQLNGILAYNTVADLKAANNIVDGSFTKTYGKITYNDGDGAFYKIRTLTSSDVIDEIHIISLTNYPTLVAELIPDNNIIYLTNSVTAIQKSITDILGDVSKIKNKTYPLKGKKILVIGDSTSNEVTGVMNWVKWIRENYEVDTIDNISYNGALLTGNGGQAKHYGDDVVNTYDIILIMLGVNDAYHQATLRELSYSNNDYNTFSGALTYLQEKIIDKNPNALVYYISPLRNNYDQNNKVFVDVYRTYIYRACNMFGWHFIDAGHNAPLLNPYNSTIKNLYIPDGIHPSEAYAPYLGKYIVDKIISGGDNSIGDYHSRMDLSHLLTTEERNAGSTLYAEYNSNGHIKLYYHNDSKSVNNGIAVVPTTDLPDWARPYSMAVGLCTMGQTFFIGRVLTSSIQLFPNVTKTDGIDFEIEYDTSLMAQPFETQI